MEKIKNEIVTQILNRVDNVFGCSELKEDLELYSKYIDLKLKNKIDFGNYNIIIHRETGGSEYKEILNIINDLLISKNIVTDRYRILKDRTLEFETENKLYVIDDNDIGSIFNYEIRDMIEKNSKNVFIMLIDGKMIVENSKIFYKKMFYWSLKINCVSEEEKENYIRKIIKKNNFIIRENSKFPEELKKCKIFDINENLIKGFIQAQNNNTGILEDKYFGITECEENEIVESIIESGLEKLDSLIGLESVKQQIHQIIDYMEIHKNRGNMPMLHMVFTGNPRHRKNNSC